MNVKSKTLSLKRLSNLYDYFILGIIFVAIGAITWRSFPIQSLDVFQISATGSVSLSLSPNTINISPDEESTVDVQMITGGSEVAAISLEFTYDPSSIEIASISNGTLLPNMLMEPQIENGKASLALAVSPDAGGQTDSGTIATIHLKALGSVNYRFW
jgi:hypothetical protein